MSLPRSDIRRMLLERGTFDLSDPDAVRELDRRVAGWDMWLHSDLVDILGEDSRKLTPRRLMANVGWSNSNKSSRNEREVIDTLHRFQAVKLIGSQSLRAAVAFAKQSCLRWGWRPHYFEASNLITQPEEINLDAGARSVAIVNVWPDVDGRIFAEVQSKIVSLLRSHKGATIIISERDEPGAIDRLVCGVLKPNVRLKVVEKR